MVSTAHGLHNSGLLLHSFICVKLMLLGILMNFLKWQPHSFPEWCLRTYSHLVDTSVDSIYQLILTASLVPRMLVVASLWLAPINAHTYDITYCNDGQASNCRQQEDKNAHNFDSKMRQLLHFESVLNGDHSSAVRIFIHLSWELKHHILTEHLFLYQENNAVLQRFHKHSSNQHPWVPVIPAMCLPPYVNETLSRSAFSYMGL